jgi:hypothetical protein
MKNIEYPRKCRRTLYGFGALAVLALIAGVAEGASTGEAVGALLGMAMSALFIGLPVVYGPRWFSIYAQEYLAADASGLHYGSKFFVPWALVERVAVRRQLIRRRVVLLAPGWRPRGITARMERRRGLPLSDYDRNWRENTELVSALRDHLPNAALP